MKGEVEKLRPIVYECGIKEIIRCTKKLISEIPEFLLLDNQDAP